jgi:alpha-tubulin suppressor-like RCC1 family protein
MTNILYRKNSNATVPSASSVKGSPLSSDEMDGNLKSISNHIDNVVGMAITNSTEINAVKNSLNTTNANVSSLESRVGNNIDVLEAVVEDLSSVFRVQNFDSTFSGYQSGQQNAGAWNTANGFRSLFSNTSGYSNSAFGNGALHSNTVGISNTATGAASLFSNISGNFNTSAGQNSMRENTVGVNNTAAGYQSLYYNVDGNNNTAVGYDSLFKNINGYGNTAVGWAAGKNNNTNGLTAIGANSLNNNTTGDKNTAVGFNSLQANTTGSKNSAFGDGALFDNISGDNNTAIGWWSLLRNTTGTNNTAVGMSALSQNTTGVEITAVGQESISKNTTGRSNTAVGAKSLYENTTGGWNIAVGTRSLHKNTEGHSNVAIGSDSLFNNTTGAWNVGIGNNALRENTTGGYNIGIGVEALRYTVGGGQAPTNEKHMYGHHNVAIGVTTLQQNTSGYLNTALGHSVLKSNTTGALNTAVGHVALNACTTGTYNTAVGVSAGANITTGSNNVVIGGNDGASIATSNNNIILSDGSGNIRASCNAAGVWDFKSDVFEKNKITYLSKSGYNHLSMILNDRLYSTAGSTGSYSDCTSGRGLNGSLIHFGVDNFQPIHFPNIGAERKIISSGGTGYQVQWALFDNGNLYTWGLNSNGQCGVGDYFPRPLPVLSATNVKEVFSHPTNGDIDVTHTRLFYLSNSGELFGCGYNAHGALGIGNTTTTIPSWTKINVPGLTASTPLKLFNLGSWVGCTVLFLNGKIYVTGYNGYGQLGTYDTNSLTTFTDVTSNWVQTTVDMLPGDTSANITDIKVSGGFGYYSTQNPQSSVTMLIKHQGRDHGYLRTCGNNTWGQRGTNEGLTNFSVPASPMIPNAYSRSRVLDFAVFGGGPATVYAMTMTESNGFTAGIDNTGGNSLYTWGYNDFGQIGRPVTSSTNAIPAWAAGNVAALHCNGMSEHSSSHYSHGFYTDNSGQLWAAGYNVQGCLGNGSTFASNNAFTKVLLPAGEEVVDLGWYSTTGGGRILLARTRQENLYAWGYNGQHGITPWQGGNVPTPILVRLPTMNKVQPKNRLPTYVYRNPAGSTVQTLNLKTEAIKLGWDGHSDFETFIIINDGIIGSNTAGDYALDTSDGWPAPVFNDTVTKNQILIINRGYIVGRGGRGSNWNGTSSTYTSERQSPEIDGGPALIARTRILIDNSNGTIAKGGGGGWSVWQGWSNGARYVYDAGGGGAGSPPGAAGIKGISPNPAPQPGTLTKGGLDYTDGKGGKDLGIPGYTENEENRVRPTITGDSFITWINKGTGLLGPIT